MHITDDDKLNKWRSGPNPYWREDASWYFGREWLFTWLEQALAEEGKNTADPDMEALPLLCLCGATQIGKTATLDQIEHGRLGNYVVPVRVAPQDLTNDEDVLQNNWQNWLWEVAKLLVTTLREQGITVRWPQKKEFMADPAQSLRIFVLAPVSQQMSGQRLLLLLDDVDRLPDNSEVRSLVRALLTASAYYPWFRILLTMRQEADSFVTETRLTNFDYKVQTLRELNPDAAVSFLRQPVPYRLYGDVERYVLALTQRHPYYLQQLCGLLFERWRTYRLREITLADVALVARSDDYLQLKPPLHPRLVTAASVMETLTWENTAVERQQSNGRGSLFGLAAVVVVAVACVALLLTLPGTRQSLLEAAGLVQTPVPTATPDVRATVVMETTQTAVALAALATDTPTPTFTPTTTPTFTPTPRPTATDTPSPTPTPGPLVVVRETDDMPMVRVPASTFARGSAEDSAQGEADEQPLREVTLDEFYLDQYEVTAVQYATFLNDQGDHREVCGNVACARTLSEVPDSFLRDESGDGGPYSVVNNFTGYPMNHVSWFGARDYCAWVGGRLPTEAEWEYAARGPDGFTFPWGEEPPNRSLAVYETEFSNLLPVDSLPAGASPFGVEGMAGSMWEWTADWYAEDYYFWGPVDNPEGPPQGTERVARGGAWPMDNPPQRLRTANRNFFRPTAMRADVGFRCAYDPENVDLNADLPESLNDE